MRYLLYIAAFTILARPAFPFVDYAVNYNYISKVLCVNKAKPMLHCNGKCHLMKELAKAAENEKPAGSEKKQQNPFFEVLFCNEQEDITFSHIPPGHKKVNAGYHTIQTSLFERTTFHPPTSI